MTAFVLVHGAWGGSYGFNKLRPLINAAGHEAFSPSLTGIGERSHLTSPTITLSTHITDVVNTVLYEDLHDIVLLGFSYGGMVVTGTLDHIGDRVSHLVYLDAMVPTDGQSVEDIRAPGHPRPRIGVGDDWAIAPIPRPLATQAETDWNNARRALQPVGTFREAVRLATPIEDAHFSRTYIKASADPNEEPDSPFWMAARHAQASPSWRYHEIATNHLVATTHPNEVAEILLGLV